jgi:hypothetical protein
MTVTNPHGTVKAMTDTDTAADVTELLATGPVTAVLGDVGGHLDALRNALEALGADTTAGTLPAGLTVVQVGDLVHRGPDSAGCVALVDRFRRADARWHQISGNHEQHYLGGELFWADTVDPATAGTLTAWWRDGWMRLAVAIDDTLLATHAGLTSGLWEHLGRPPGAVAAAAAICDPEHRDAALRSGFMLDGGATDHAAGVVWAEASREVCSSWIGTNPPFDQVCGHTNPYRFADRRPAVPGVADAVDTFDVDIANRRTRVVIGDATLWFVDAGLGRRGGTLPALLVGRHGDGLTAAR